jgi:hypothetical protein
VVGGAERACSGKDGRGVGTGNASHALYGEHRKALFVVEGRENPREPAREHRFADAGRPEKQEIVPARRCDFEGAARERLSANVGEFVETGDYACRLHITWRIEGASIVEGIGDFREVVSDADLKGAGTELKGSDERRFGTV